MSEPKRVLIVDDDDETRSQLALLVELLGYETLQAGGETEALKQVESDKADVMITDLRLPDGDGTKLIQKLHETQPDFPVIVLTAYPSDESIAESVREKVFSYLTKPVQGEQLRVVLQRLFETAA